MQTPLQTSTLTHAIGYVYYACKIQKGQFIATKTRKSAVFWVFDSTENPDVSSLIRPMSRFFDRCQIDECSELVELSPAQQQLPGLVQCFVSSA
jgi:hypothetical protein